jgi:hypothetical protein
MLKEFWASMRGIDKWPEIAATVRSVERYDGLSGGGRYAPPRKLADVTFAYTDTLNDHQYGWITVQDSSSLYDLKEDDTFSIRVNPKHPERYYSPEATKAGF